MKGEDKCPNHSTSNGELTLEEYVIAFEHIGANDIDRVGGKNASLGEMISNLKEKKILVPRGFATTVQAYSDFLNNNSLSKEIDSLLNKLNVHDIEELQKTGKHIRSMILGSSFSSRFEDVVNTAFSDLTSKNPDVAVAVRSSATAEDLPDASFAGQQETYLNIQGYDNVIKAIKKVFASLYNDRAISYRVDRGFNHNDVSISAGIQYMVRSDIGSSGVMFTIDTESGFDKVVFITSAYGLGETVVQGAVNPDEFYVYKNNIDNNIPAILRKNMGEKALKMTYSGLQEVGKSVKLEDVNANDRNKFSISDSEVEELAKQALVIERHYNRPMDIEWAKDGSDGKLYVVQARPETVKSRQSGRVVERYILKERTTVLVEGRSIGQKIGKGVVKIINNISEISRVQEGDVLVTDMTDPDWEPIMKKTSGIVTNRGGRTCHAAIISRELGIPAVVGCNDATKRLKDGQKVTVSCAEGDTGIVYEGLLDFDINISETKAENLPKLPFEIMMNIGNPDRSFGFASLPNAGVGLARLEFIINRMIGIHPKALIEFDNLPNELKETISEKIQGYTSPTNFFIDKLAEGVASISASFYPKKVIVRLSDFKSNEYENLIGGSLYEPKEENPMLGYRGASRYVSKEFRECFDLECEAIKKVRNDMKLTNIELMIPFVRTVDEAKQVIDLLKENNLERGVDGLRIIMMCELPTNALLSEQFLEYFDGFSIGSNDMTQLTLGLDRDSGLIAHLFDERDDAVKVLLSMAIQSCKKLNKYIGICGQGPSDYPDFAQWLMKEGIDTVSLNPDSVMDTWLYLGKQINS